VKVTAYFEAIRQRPDRAVIQNEWIERANREPIREHVQADGRIRRWVQVPEMEGRYLRVVLLSEGRQFTTHSSIVDSSHEDPLLR
jgi:membrane carboxypeptidase/penicillin-binding protein PbpC